MGKMKRCKDTEYRKTDRKKTDIIITKINR